MSNDLISRKEAERFLRAYADEVGCNRGDYEYADGIEVNSAVKIVRAELKV